MFQYLNTLRIWSVRLINELYSLIISRLLKNCGNNFRIKLSSTIVSPDNINIGNNFSSMGSMYLYSNQGELIIGNNVRLNTNVHINASGGKVTIGDDVLIAPNVVIRCCDHDFKRSCKINEQAHLKGEITIGDDVWIASNAVITANVSLANGTVVAAGAVVTKSTEPYSIVAGVPARKIGERQ